MQRQGRSHPKSFWDSQRIHQESPVDPGMLPGPVEPLQLKAEFNFFITLGSQEKQPTGRIQAIKIFLWKKNRISTLSLKVRCKGMCTLQWECSEVDSHAPIWLNENPTKSWTCPSSTSDLYSNSWDCVKLLGSFYTILYTLAEAEHRGNLEEPDKFLDMFIRPGMPLSKW